ncbi:MAG: hypothetical protein RQ756_01245 [Flavobacteriaceae bacterium]|nr:hypothetical protein [Flavobacteriaceae bacterium]
MIYTLNITLDSEDDDVSRQIAIDSANTLEDLHFYILQSFSITPEEPSCFYLSNDAWEQIEEFPMEELQDSFSSSSRTMEATKLSETINLKQRNLIYVYDFLNLWTFFVQLTEISVPEAGITYPVVLNAQGQLPERAPEKSFDRDNDPEDDFDLEEFEDDFDEFDDLDSFDDFNYN